MKNHRISKITLVADLFICTVWMLLLVHEDVYNAYGLNSFILIYPALRIWISFATYHRSKLVIVPIALLSLMTICLFCGRESTFILFAEPMIDLFNNLCALFNVELVSLTEYQAFVIDIYDCKLPISVICSIWMLIIPLGVYIYRLCKKQLQPGCMSMKKCIGVCTYIFTAVLIATIIFSATYNPTLAYTVLVLMLLIIPVIFNRGRIKGMLSRSEVVYLLTLAMFAVGYIFGIGLENKSVLAIGVFPAAFFALFNWYLHRETTYKDIVLIVAASIVFWYAQYTTNMARILLLFVSLALTAVPVIRFAMDTKKYWVSAGLYAMAALIMPVFCLGYNPYSVLEAKRAYHFDDYSYSHNGLLCVICDETIGLRDRFGVILPVDEYNRIILLNPSKPYCKVKKDGKWQIYDIERQELVSDELFSDVEQCGDFTYLLKSIDGDKYLTIPHYYNRYAAEQPAVIVDELPVEDGVE